MASRQAGRKKAQESASGGANSAGSLDIRLRPQDRVGGGQERIPPRVRRRADEAPPKPAKETRKGRAGNRFGIGRLFYWCAVLALWGVIAAIAVLVWVGIHLPPIQSLEIPKRP